MTTAATPGGSDVTATRQALAAVVDRLTVLRADLAAELAESPADDVWALGSGGHAPADNHPADEATTVFERELDAGLVRGVEAHLAEAHRAMEKLSEGSYGRCDRCGSDIAAGRLRARPESTLCLKCAGQGGVGAE